MTSTRPCPRIGCTQERVPLAPGERPVPGGFFPPAFTPDPRHVEVIEFEITGPPNASDLATLSAEEEARAARFHFERDRSRFIRARAGLRIILGACLRREPASIPLVRGPHGKPALGSLQSRVRFNLSHSGNRCLVAIALGREVGVDLEQVRGGVDHLELASRYFTEGEYDAILRQPVGSLCGFFRCWVAKEAYLKARGEGLQSPLNAFEVDPGEQPDCLRWSRLPECRRWRVERVALDAPHVAAVAAEWGDWAVRLWRGLPVGPA